MFSELGKYGITEEQLKDKETAQFVVSFVNAHGGPTKKAPPPPPPRAKKTQTMVNTAQTETKPSREQYGTNEKVKSESTKYILPAIRQTQKLTKDVQKTEISHKDELDGSVNVIGKPPPTVTPRIPIFKHVEQPKLPPVSKVKQTLTSKQSENVSCPICGEEMVNLRQLDRHLDDAHATPVITSTVVAQHDDKSGPSENVVHKLGGDKKPKTYMDNLNLPPPPTTSSNADSQSQKAADLDLNVPPEISPPSIASGMKQKLTGLLSSKKEKSQSQKDVIAAEGMPPPVPPAPPLPDYASPSRPAIIQTQQNMPTPPSIPPMTSTIPPRIIITLFQVTILSSTSTSATISFTICIWNSSTYES